MQKNVLGIRIDDLPKTEILQKISRWMKNSRCSRLVFTPGPEFLVTAQKDLEFKNVLNSSDLNVPDGFGLRLFGGIKNIYPGVDLVRDLCQLATKNGWTVGIIGNPNAKLSASKLAEKYPGIKIHFALDNPEADKILNDCEVLRPIMNEIDSLDLLFVGVGHPRQEKFLFKLKISNFKFQIGVGVGGSFDFISGAVREPPAWLSKLGLKWLGRLVFRPRYMLPKAWKAAILYPWLSLSQILRRRGG